MLLFLKRFKYMFLSFWFLDPAHLVSSHSSWVYSRRLSEWSIATFSVCVSIWMGFACEVIYGWFFLCVCLLDFKNTISKEIFIPNATQLPVTSMFFLEPTACEIVIYMVLNAFLFFLWDASEVVLITGWIENYYVEWISVLFIGAWYLYFQNFMYVRFGLQWF